MIQRSFFIFAAIIAIVFSACQPERTDDNSSPTNSLQSPSEHLVMATLWFQQSAENRALYYQTYNLAKILIDQKLANTTDTTGKAVVVDIDETLLDNSPYEVMLIETGQTYHPDSWLEWTALASARPLPGSVDFLNYVSQRGLEIFYISNRRVTELEVTMKNLNLHGFPEVVEERIFLKDTTSDKTFRRQKVSELGYEIILFIGDNLTDYSQDFAHRGSDFGAALVDEHKDEFGRDFLILPNPMYGEWEKAVYGNDWTLDSAQRNEKRRQALDGLN